MALDILSQDSIHRRRLCPGASIYEAEFPANLHGKLELRYVDLISTVVFVGSTPFSFL